VARYKDADCKLCRREGMKLYLKGSKCESPKCPVEKRPFPPGQHGRGRRRESEYLLRLREKQKARRIYGVLVLHRHVLLNGRITKTPSVLVRIGDSVQVKEKSRSAVRVLEARERSQSRTIPGWLAVNMDVFETKVVSVPERSDIDAPVKESFVVEFYSR
jgi:small subunit ribosomal protein S4